MAKFSSSYQSMNDYKRLSTVYRLLPLLALLPTTAVSIALMQNEILDKKNVDHFYVWIRSHTVEVNIIVNVLAQAFAFVQLLALANIISFSTRASLPTKAVSLNTLKLWHAIIVNQVDWSLSVGTLLVALCYAVASFLPSIGWVAAITPSFGANNVTTSISVPIYTTDPIGGFFRGSYNAFIESTTYHVDNDIFSFVPGATMANMLLTSAATASSNTSAARVHRKSDGSAYNYVGRSYGLGAPIGLANMTSPVLASYTGYIYNDTGYYTNVSCFYNSTSNWQLSLEQTPDSSSLPLLYMAQGILPPGVLTDGYAVASFGGNDSIVAIIAGGASITNNIAITAGSSYDALDKIQCAVNFHAAKFRVAVSSIGQNITISPLMTYALGSAEDIDPTSSKKPHARGLLQQMVLWEITRLSQRNIALYSSLIGESFKANIQQRANVTNWNETNTEQILAAVGESFEAMIDDILLAISSAQYVVGPKSARKDAPVVMTVGAVILGTPKGIYGMFAFNTLLLLIWIIEWRRTRFWRDAPAWDYRVLANVAIASSRGGSGMADASIKLGNAKEDVHKLEVNFIANGDGHEALVYNDSKESMTNPLIEEQEMEDLGV